MKPALIAPPRVDAAAEGMEVAIHLDDCREKVTGLEMWTES